MRETCFPAVTWNFSSVFGDLMKIETFEIETGVTQSKHYCFTYLWTNS